MGALSGKVVLVTGGGNGIGRDCALIAAQEGAKVVVNDLGGGLGGGDEGSAGPAESVAQEIRAAGGEAVSNSDSVTDLDAVYGMVEQAKKEFGGLHAVINPAGILRDVMFHKMTEAEWDSAIAVLLALAVVFVRSITAPLERLRHAIVSVAGNNDFTQRVGTQGKDEIAQTASAFNRLLESIQNSLREVLGNSENIATASEQVSSASPPSSTVWRCRPARRSSRCPSSSSGSSRRAARARSASRHRPRRPSSWCS